LVRDETSPYHGEVGTSLIHIHGGAVPGGRGHHAAPTHQCRCAIPGRRRRGLRVAGERSDLAEVVSDRVVRAGTTGQHRARGERRDPGVPSGSDNRARRDPRGHPQPPAQLRVALVAAGAELPG